ncbi:MAG: hypothetical protein A2V85_10110 [Chloroflexi bacterium RBG_16_72_14]|nr:MAG: hypothetical protein A2V85_10110 [Chloroflexi bacterium RBG_16_72_14]
MRLTARSIASLAFAAALVAACGAAAAPTPVPTTPEPTSAAPPPSPTTRPVPTPTTLPQTDGEGDEIVFGTDDIVLSTPYTETKVGDVRQMRGGILTIQTTMNDPRVTGSATFSFGVDYYTKAGTEWGTFRLENAGGAWEGTCSGAVWEEGNHAIGACWLVGSAGYEGYTYYRAHQWDYAYRADVEGIIFPGAPPAP